MDISRKKEFDSITQRILYGFNFVYSDFMPVDSDMATDQEQEKLHDLMGQIINKLYETPALLGLPENPDEAYEWYMVSNQKPALSAIYLSIYKTLYEFYKFLYIAALHGDMNGDSLFISNETLKANKTGYKPIYNKLLNEVGMEAVKDKSGVSIQTDKNILAALKLLAVKVPTNINKWTPYELADFVCCSFNGDKDYLLRRTDNLNGLNGLLMELKNKCLEKGYNQELNLHFASTDLSFTIYFKNEVGGFQIGYNSRKYWQFSFGTINGIGEKAMLEHFDNLDDDMKQHFINICRPCSGCLVCTKSGKNKIFTVHVNYAGKDYSLCPSFPYHAWETLDSGLMNVLFKYHDLQIKYGEKK
ncbi:MAG: hypothetical protein PHD66_09295 [Eubacteriales bacterium]|nr:hypothetical protein [Eubacteriales bacterium]